MLRRFALALSLGALIIAGSLGATPRAAVFTVPPVDAVSDLHGNPAGAQLVIFMAGNQYMLMPALLAAFRERYPRARDIYYETLPPGIVALQMERGSLSVGNLLVSARPDVFMSGGRRMLAMQRDGYVGKSWVYATNDLAIMVHAGNPRNIRSLRDLGRPEVRVAMPNPQWEGIGEQIEAAYRKAGGEALMREIMITKVADGTTMLTRIHHRQTPMFILDGRADAGPVWISEALYERRIGAPIAYVPIPREDNVTARYEAAEVREAPHASLAKAFVEFLNSPAARTIYRSYGFGAPK